MSSTTSAIVLVLVMCALGANATLSSPSAPMLQKPLWQHNMSFYNITGMDNGAVGPLCADEDMVYFMTRRPVIGFAYNLRTGKQMWNTTDLPNIWLANHITSCSKKDGIVVFASHTMTSVGVYDRMTGKKIWVSSSSDWTSNFIFGPAITQKGIVAVTGNETQTSCTMWSIKDGSQVWHTSNCVPGNKFRPNSQRLVANDVYFFASSSEKQSDATFTCYLYAYELETGKLAWKSAQLTGLPRPALVIDMNYQPSTDFVISALSGYYTSHIVGTNVSAVNPTAAFSHPFTMSPNMFASLVAPSPDTKFSYIMTSSNVALNALNLGKGAPDGEIGLVLHGINGSQSVPSGWGLPMNPVVVSQPGTTTHTDEDLVVFATPQGVYGVRVTPQGGEYMWWYPCVGGLNWFSLVSGSGIVVAPISFTGSDASIAAFRAFP